MGAFAIVGASVSGTNVGALEDTRNGAVVGTTVGRNVGSTDGAIGCIVGALDGISVSIAVGFSLCAILGELLGCSDGALELAILGVVLGDKEDFSLETRDGTADSVVGKTAGGVGLPDGG